MTYYTITTQIKGMTKSDQGYNFVKSNSGKINGHMMFRLHLLKYQFCFDQCEAGTYRDAERIDLRNKKITGIKILNRRLVFFTELKSCRFKTGINLTINLN